MPSATASTPFQTGSFATLRSWPLCPNSARYSVPVVPRASSTIPVPATTWSAASHTHQPANTAAVSKPTAAPAAMPNQGFPVW